MNGQDAVAINMNTTAILAAALIAASGRPHSVDEAVKLMHDFHWSLFPNPNNGAYKDWKRTFNGGLRHT
jgi:hypothetical protein